MTTKFKIITPAYNCADSIRQTIFSIAGQTYQNWEMVIINDVSTDDTVAAIEKLSEEMGGWIFHQKVDFSRKTPHISVRKNQPKIMN